MSVWTALLRLIRARPGFAALNVALATTIALLDLLPGLATQALFDRLTGATPIGVAPEAIIGALLALALARTVIKTSAVLIDELHGFLLAALLRHNLLARLLARPTPGIEAEATGATLSRLRDDVARLTEFVAFLCYGVAISALAGAAFFVLARVDAGLTVAVFLPVAATTVIVRWLSGRVGQFRAASQRATADLTGALGEVFDAVAAVQLAGAERHLLAHLRRLGEERRRLVVRDLVLTRGTGAASAFTVSLGTGLLLLLSAGAQRSGQFTVGDFALFVYCLPFVGEFTRVVGALLSGYRQAGIATGRLVAVTADADPRPLLAPASLALRGPLPTLPSPPVLSASERFVALDARGLTSRHPATDRGIAGVDLRVARGEFVVVVGRIGAGKTTLLRTLLGQLPAEEGSVRWNGAAIADPATWMIPPRVAYTPQVPRLFSDTLRDNILLGLSDGAVDLPGAIRDALLTRDLAALPEGIATTVGARGVRLSGGQVQRAAAARMLVRGAELLIVDDLSSALDVETERALWARLRAREGASILAVSHRRAALEQADRIVVLRAGRVVATGPLARLLAECEEMRLLWEEEG